MYCWNNFNLIYLEDSSIIHSNFADAIYHVIYYKYTISTTTWSELQKVKADAEGLSKKLQALEAYKM